MNRIFLAPDMAPHNKLAIQELKLPTFFEELTDTHLRVLWRLLQNVPRNYEEDGKTFRPIAHEPDSDKMECLDEDFFIWIEGTSTAQVHAWFDEQSSKGLRFRLEPEAKYDPQIGYKVVRAVPCPNVAPDWFELYSSNTVDRPWRYRYQTGFMQNHPNCFFWETERQAQIEAWSFKALWGETKGFTPRIYRCHVWDVTQPTHVLHELHVPDYGEKFWRNSWDRPHRLQWVRSWDNQTQTSTISQIRPSPSFPRETALSGEWICQRIELLEEVPLIYPEGITFEVVHHSS